MAYFEERSPHFFKLLSVYSKTMKRVELLVVFSEDLEHLSR